MGEVEGEVQEERPPLVPPTVKELERLVREPGFGVPLRGNGAREAFVRFDSLPAAVGSGLGGELGVVLGTLVAHLYRSGLHPAWLIGVPLRPGTSGSCRSPPSGIPPRAGAGRAPAREGPRRWDTSGRCV